MNNLILFLNWILNWMVFYRYSMFEWIIKIYRSWLPERPMTPQECPKQHKTLCLVGLYCYSTFSHTSRSFGDSLGTQLGLIWPKNSLFWPSEGPTVVGDLKKYFEKFVRGLYFNQFFSLGICLKSGLLPPTHYLLTKLFWDQLRNCPNW